MPRRQSTGEIRVGLAPSVANLAAPTVAECNASVDLTPFMRRDGLNTPKGGNVVDGSDASSRYNKTSRGTYGGDPVTYMGYRDDVAADDDAWSALPDGTSGVLIVRRFGGSDTAWAAGQRVECWPIEVITREMANIAENENQRFSVSMAVPRTPNDDAVIAA